MKHAWAVCLIVLISCGQERTGERLAQQHCASCHLFTDPSMLDKKTWDKHVLPQMAFRMGLDLTPLMTLNENDMPYVVKTLPKTEMVTQEQFETIRQYFLREAPDTLSKGNPFTTHPLTQFEVTPVRLSGFGANTMISMVAADTASKKLWVGTRQSHLISYSFVGRVLDSMTITSPPSAMLFPRDEAPLVSVMGIMDPNDQPKGQLLRYGGGGKVTVVADSLKRPVHFEQADLNNDGKKDLVVCAFGNYAGELIVMENTGDTYRSHVVSHLPGARKVIIKDLNGDNRPDILAMLTQGDEQISLLTNAGNFNFRITTLLRFPPVMGSSYFDIGDFNNDGHWDIMATNGDNADYSIVLKPYHGVRIYLNDGRNQFKESWFHPMHGSSKALARDFDSDGDLDIAAISFFPDFEKHAEQGFIYFRNDGGSFTPETTPFGASGRWLVMDALDIDGDKDIDLVLGALNFNDGIPGELSRMWTGNPIHLLVLKNNQTK